MSATQLIRDTTIVSEIRISPGRPASRSARG